jgi:hypothetical protein
MAPRGKNPKELERRLRDARPEAGGAFLADAVARTQRAGESTHERRRLRGFRLAPEFVLIAAAIAVVVFAGLAAGSHLSRGGNFAAANVQYAVPSCTITRQSNQGSNLIVTVSGITTVGTVRGTVNQGGPILYTIPPTATSGSNATPQTLPLTTTVAAANGAPDYVANMIISSPSLSGDFPLTCSHKFTGNGTS